MKREIPTSRRVRVAAGLVVITALAWAATAYIVRPMHRSGTPEAAAAAAPLSAAAPTEPSTVPSPSSTPRSSTPAAATPAADGTAVPAPPTSYAPASTAPSTPATTLPPLMVKDNTIHRGNFVTCTIGTDESLAGATALVGDPVFVPGFRDRPTMLQVATDPSAPIVVLFHGQHGCIRNLQSRTDLDSIATARGVSLLWLSGAPLPARSWRANYGCCEPASTNQADDLGYLDAAVAAIRARGLHPRRFLSVGVSNGAGMALTAACSRPELFDVAVSVAGWLPVPCEVDRPMSLLAFGGTADEDFDPYMPRAIAGVWTQVVTHCPDPPVVESTPQRNITTWTGCSNGTLVRVVSLPGIPHVWPKFTFYDIDDDILALALDQLR